MPALWILAKLIKHDGTAAGNDAGKSAFALGNLHSCAALRILADCRILARDILRSRIA